MGRSLLLPRYQCVQTTVKRKRNRFFPTSAAGAHTRMCAAPSPMPFVHAGTCFPNRPVYRHYYTVVRRDHGVEPVIRTYLCYIGTLFIIIIIL